MAIIKCPNCGTSCENDRLSCPICNFAFEESKFYKNELTDEELGKVAKWYYMNGDEKMGPYRFSQMQALIEELRVTERTIVFTENSNAKTSAINTILFSKKTNKYVDAQDISNKSLWLLCVIPSSLFLMSTFMRLGGSAFLCVIPMLLSIVFHYVFMIMEMKYLKQSFERFGKWVFIGFIPLFPVYPFIRASKTNKCYAPAIFGTVLYVLSSILFNML